MIPKPVDQLGELQRAVLEAVWELDGATVQEVLDHLKPARNPAYTTVLTTLQNLTRGGWIKPGKSGRAYVYHATRSREQAGARSIAAFVRRVFEGNTRVMFQALLDQENLSEAELIELRKMIDRKRREKK